MRATLQIPCRFGFYGSEYLVVHRVTSEALAVHNRCSHWGVEHPDHIVKLFFRIDVRIWLLRDRHAEKGAQWLPSLSRLKSEQALRSECVLHLFGVVLKGLDQTLTMVKIAAVMIVYGPSDHSPPFGSVRSIL